MDDNMILDPLELNDSELEEESPRKRAKKPSRVTVALLDTKVREDGTYLAYNVDTLEGYLIPEKHLSYSSKPQEVDQSVLDASMRPYDFTEEIEAVLPSMEHIRLVLWRNGLLSKEDLDTKKRRNALLGAFPQSL